MNTLTAINSPIESAFLNARAAQPAWAATPLAERLACIRRVRHLMAERAKPLARSTQGSIGESLAAQVLPLADACRFLELNAPKLLAHRKLGRRGRPLWLRRVESTVVRQPCGVVLIIAPANYPIFLPGVQLFQALAAGNAVLLKPGHGGAAAAMALRELCRDAGVDERLVAVLPATDAAARDAIDLPVDKIFFTGSSDIGKKVLAWAAARVIPTVVELSGCDAAIVRADADVRMAARALSFGLRFNNSATCIAPRRVLVARRCLEQLEAEMVACIRARAADMNDPRLGTAIVDSLARGATALVGGIGVNAALHLPCVLVDVRPEMPIAQLDTFAPILSIIAFDSDEEAIAIANDSLFALGASIFSTDQTAAKEIACRLDAGIVTINDVIVPTADPRVPFGGRKQSGFGITRGAEGLLEMTQLKVVQLRRGKQRAHFDASLTKHSSDIFASFIEMMHAGQLKKRLRSFGCLLSEMKRARRR